jgi:hypothetical protein
VTAFFAVNFTFLPITAALALADRGRGAGNHHVDRVLPA